jgi:hypothetical protein
MPEPAPRRDARTPSRIAGWVVSALAGLFMVFGAVMKLASPETGAAFERLGYREGHAVPIAITELVCAVLYLTPQTAVLGAILLTGYLGGATATHVRVDEPFFMPVAVGVTLWIGLVLREPRLRALVPWRRVTPPTPPGRSEREMSNASSIHTHKETKP